MTQPLDPDMPPGPILQPDSFVRLSTAELAGIGDLQALIGERLREALRLGLLQAEEAEVDRRILWGDGPVGGPGEPLLGILGTWPDPAPAPLAVRTIAHVMPLPRALLERYDDRLPVPDPALVRLRRAVRARTWGIRERLAKRLAPWLHGDEDCAG